MAPREELRDFYRCLPEDYTGRLPDASPLAKLDIGPVDDRWRGPEEKSLLAVFGR
jgi:hypothetical protein